MGGFVRFGRYLCALGILGTLASLAGEVPGSDASPPTQEANSRVFRLEYGAKVSRLPAGASVRAWLPLPTTGPHQTVTVLERRLPEMGLETAESKYGNRILYFETTAKPSGTLEFNTVYQVARNEVLGLSVEGQRDRALSDHQRQLFLSANHKVPIGGKPLRLIESLQLADNPLGVGRALYNVVDDHVRYDKSRPGYGNGDVLWVCDSRFGNCTDFHSLFISLARSRGLPARFEIGFPLPNERGAGPIAGYHCWAYFFVDGHGWVPVDISEADKHPEMKDYYFGNLTEDRVTFTVWRDLELVPNQAGPPINFFIYPYIEVDGQPWPERDIQLVVRYQDQ